ncbi:GDP-mannose 4,6-dehydratase [Viridibacillus sp. YIM B01967]|uniref:GDP-mannose 4,6-dehydratase n=1 Tax=Viridibacillus soli TaxID=2798301 RepID=A0ABS1H4Z2_9BACL|nr:NAD-dependent epimerase/dehydratase family protein [Viridibacillus soli]MBK3494476.1 GDP-mannose 4,6-dehydratase [Viridibacillus soli]
MTKAIVTGGAGFIGSHLVDELLSKGTEVFVIDNFSSGNSSNLNPNAKLFNIDIGDFQIKSLIQELKPDALFHLAAQADVGRSVGNPSEDERVNINGTINLLQGCVEASVPKFIFSSTSAVYGNIQRDIITEKESTTPSSFYGLSKLAAEYYIRLFYELFGLRYTILRYANVYGPRQLPKGDGGVVSVFLDRIKRAELIKVHGDGEQTRDFIYVKDVVSANIASLHKADGKTLHISTGESISINNLLKLIEGIHRLPIKKENAPSRTGDIRHSCLSNQLAKEYLQWQPDVPLLEGLRHAYLK